jgi:hypothetical protein
MYGRLKPRALRHILYGNVTVQHTYTATNCKADDYSSHTFHDNLFAKSTLESKVQIQAASALPSMDTKEWLRAQWSNPTDIFTILLIFGGEVVQVAMAQLCAGPVPYLTPVSFSFGWVSILRNHHCGLEPSTPY